MKKDGLLAEILNAVVSHERKKVKTGKPDYYLNQKKQIWYAMMNRVDEDAPSPDGEASEQPPSGSGGDSSAGSNP